MKTLCVDYPCNACKGQRLKKESLAVTVEIKYL